MSKITGEGSPAEMLLRGINTDSEPKTVKVKSETVKSEPKKIVLKDKTKSESKPKKRATKQNADSENRSRRVQCVFTPSLYEKLSDTAWKERISVNEAIVQAITEYIERR